MYASRNRSLSITGSVLRAHKEPTGTRTQEQKHRCGVVPEVWYEFLIFRDRMVLPVAVTCAKPARGSTETERKSMFYCVT